MKCAEPMRCLGPVDVAAFTDVLFRQPEDLWTADSAFSRKLAPYRTTQSIYLLMTVGGVDAPTAQLAGWEPLREVYAPLAARVASFFPAPGRVLNAQVASLPAGAEILEHIDAGPVLKATHRVHLPLKTNPDVDFFVEGKNMSLSVGQAYELDNMRTHSVHNRGSERRIHLIFDYLEEPVATPVVA